MSPGDRSASNTCLLTALRTTFGGFGRVVILLYVLLRAATNPFPSIPHSSLLLITMAYGFCDIARVLVQRVKAGSRSVPTQTEVGSSPTSAPKSDVCPGAQLFSHEYWILCTEESVFLDRWHPEGEVSFGVHTNARSKANSNTKLKPSYHPPLFAHTNHKINI